jgi:uncharacterized protein with beta-barrel porin domain
MSVDCRAIWARPLAAAALGLVLVSGLGRPAAAQFLPSYSVAVGLPNPTGLTTLPGLNTAQQSMAQSINNVCPTINTIATGAGQKDLAGICSAMIGNAVTVQNQPNPLGLPSYGLDANGLKSALTQLNGGVETVVPTSQATTVEDRQSSVQSGVVEARLSQLRNRMSGTAFASLGDQPAYQLAAAGVSDVPLGPASSNPWSGRLGVFADGIGAFGSRDATGRQNGYSFGNGGFIAGADYQFTPQFAAGAAFGYMRDSTDFAVSPQSPAGQFLHSDLFQGNLYGTYIVSPSLYLEGAATIGGGSSDSRRHIVIPSTTGIPGIDRFAAGSFGNRSYGASLGGGYAVPLGLWTLTATGRFQYDREHADGFTESGASGADLTYGTTAHNAFLSFLGGQAQYTVPTAWGTFAPLARFEWAHQYNRGNTAVSVAYAEDPSLLSSFVLPGDVNNHDYYDVGVSLAMQFTPATSGFIAYDAILGLDHTSVNSIIGGLRIRF